MIQRTCAAHNDSNWQKSVEAHLFKHFSATNQAFGIIQFLKWLLMGKVRSHSVWTIAQYQ